VGATAARSGYRDAEGGPVNRIDGERTDELARFRKFGDLAK